MNEKISRATVGERPSTAHEARRFILAHMPGCLPVSEPPAGIERYSGFEDAAKLLSPIVIEGDRFTAVDIGFTSLARGVSGFGAFLDGTQDVTLVSQDKGIPIFWGVVSAAIRARVDRRLVSWKGMSPIVSRHVYLPFRYVESLVDGLTSNSLFVDTAAADGNGAIPSRHPAELTEFAINKVRRDRERVELELAESWCTSETSCLYVDGSISGSAIVAGSPVAIGVSKTHRRLYAEGDAFGVLTALKSGERTSIFRVEPRTRSQVASWYVRIRPPEGRDALFGLVRIEAAHTPDILDRANELSRWVMAEGAPLSLPDGRWDKLAYGIRGTEEFLRATS